jgi:hypothetical protein
MMRGKSNIKNTFPIAVQIACLWVLPLASDPVTIIALHKNPLIKYK